MRPRDRISLAAGGAALLGAVLVIGGAPRWAQAGVAVLVALALLAQLGSRRRLDHASPLVVLLGCAVVFTAVQLIPLPEGLLDALSPRGNELRADGAALAGTAPWHTISLDPPGTLRALAFFVILLGVALLGLRIASSERGRYLVLAGVAITCGLAAAVTGIHTLLNLDRLYGMYAPQHATPPILAPLLNPNHLGGLMAIGAVLAVGLAFYQHQAAQLRVLWVVIAVGCSATALASQSRGAALALGLGVVTMIALLVAGRLSASGTTGDGQRRALINDVPITIVIAAGLALAVYTSAGKVADQLGSTSLVELGQPLSKYAAWKSSLGLVEEAPWVGIGRGALEPAFTRVHEASAYVTFSHLENEYIQAVVEWGVPGAIVLGLLFARCIMVAVKRWRDGALAAAAIGACAAITFQSTVDFGVELLGIAVPVVLVATTLLGVRLRESRPPGPRAEAIDSGPQRSKHRARPESIDSGPLRSEDRNHLAGRVPLVGKLLAVGGPLAGIRAARGAIILALAAAAVVLVLPVTRSVQEDHDWLTGAPDAALADMRQAIERHPLDYLAYGEAAAHLLRTGDPRAARFLNHALVLHPTHPGLHRLAARMLIAGGRRAQGAIEYALALRGTLAPKQLVVEIVTLLPEVDLAARALPIDTANRAQILRSLNELGRDDIALRWLGLVVTGPQRDLAAIDELYRLAMRRHDLPAAEQAARRRLTESHTNASRIMLARVMFRREQFDQVIQDLADVPKWRGRIDEQADAWLLVCDCDIEKRAWDPALECLHKLDGSGVIAATQRNEVVRRLTIVNEQRAREAKQKAIEEMQRALGSDSKSP